MSVAEGWTGLVFLNPGEAEITITIRAYDDSGVLVAEAEIPLSPKAHMSGFLSKFFAGDVDVTAATYMNYEATGNIIAVQCSGSDDGLTLSSMPGI